MDLSAAPPYWFRHSGTEENERVLWCLLMRGQELIKQAVSHLPESQSPATDARQLLSFVSQIPYSQVVYTEIPEEIPDRFWEIVSKRATGIPVQHLTREAAFRNLILEVGPGVFIPRPETELLVELGLAKLHGINDPIVVDLCTGSGAIARAFAEESNAKVYAVEIDEKAFDYGKRNLANNDVTLVLGDFRNSFPELDSQVDLLVSNPPYVPEESRQDLPADVLEDPELALFGGEDGLELYPDLITTAYRLLKPGGWLIFEHDDTHGEAVPDLIRKAGGFESVNDEPDLSRRPRFTLARKEA